MPFANVDGQRLYYEDSGGSGPPVIFSHGFLMDHEMFAPQVEALSPEFRCITWDERGFGRTEATGPFTYYDSAADCLGLLSHLGIDRAVLAGMSQGGFLSLRAALSAPERVKALVLIDTESGAFDEEAKALYGAMFGQWQAQGPDALADTVAELILGGGYDPSAWIAKWKARPNDVLAHPSDALVQRDDVTGRLGELTCPAIVFHGEEDQAIPMERAEALCEGLPNCVGLVRVPGAAHAPNLTSPDAVNGPLREFLAKHA